jgi:hypothetical protein
VEGAFLDRLVDPGHERAMLGLDRSGVAAVDRALEPAEMGLHGARQQPVLRSLAAAA